MLVHTGSHLALRSVSTASLLFLLLFWFVFSVELILRSFSRCDLETSYGPDGVRGSPAQQDRNSALKELLFPDVSLALCPGIHRRAGQEKKRDKESEKKKTVLEILQTGFKTSTKVTSFTHKCQTLNSVK